VSVYTFPQRPGAASRQPARCHALVPCAGTGTRSGAALPKQYVKLAGRSLVAHTVEALQAVAELQTLLVVLSPDDRHIDEALPPAQRPPHLKLARCGGATRAETVARGLSALLEAGADADDWVLVHDAARCLVRPAWVQRLIDACRDDPVGGLLALPLADTLKDVQRQPPLRTVGGPEPGPLGDGARVGATLERAGKWLAQTPQMFRIGPLSAALSHAGAAVTDEASAMEAVGLAPRLVEGTMENFKLTYPADFELAERLLKTR
jgi:2-C-methyl-D-erythritol 4-phosphate cytidylyltransferase